MGGGSGVDSVALARRGGLATLLDYSEAALAAARTTARREGMTIQLVGADAHRMPFGDGSFDAVFHQGFLEHFRDPMPILVEQRRVLKRVGVLLVDVPQKYSFYTLEKRRKIREGTWFAGWETEYSLGELERLVAAAGFQVVRTFGRDLQPFLARIRSLSAAGTRRIGRPYLPRKVAHLYDRVWSFLESRRTVYRFCLSVGVVARRPG